MLILEIIASLIIIALIIITYVLTRKVLLAVEIVRMMLPFLKQIADKTETHLDDKIVSFFESVLDDTSIKK